MLDAIEADQQRANMMLLYERGFEDHLPAGLFKIHGYLLGDIYDSADQYRIINIGKRKQMLVGLVTVQQRRRYPCDLRVVFDHTDAVCNEPVIYNPDTLGHTDTL